jgi:hypothetical protein
LAIRRFDISQKNFAFHPKQFSAEKLEDRHLAYHGRQASGVPRRVAHARLDILDRLEAYLP